MFSYEKDAFPYIFTLFSYGKIGFPYNLILFLYRNNTAQICFSGPYEM